MEYSQVIAPLPLGMSSFSALRNRGKIYVDKTRSIYELAVRDGRYFLSRPRRFGKSLLISTFESLFERGIQDFKGLAIESLWTEAAVYTVVRLDFSSIRDFKSKEDFVRMFRDQLQVKFGAVGFPFDKQADVGFLEQLASWIGTLPDSSCVLLVDEYDTPLTSCLSKPDLFEEVRAELSKFYAKVKEYDRVWRFVFITGITRFNKASIFSALNHLSDISFDRAYSGILGYTADEIVRFFPDQIAYASEVLSLDCKDVLREITRNYDGYCFDSMEEKGEAVRVHCPWSVLKFFERPQKGFQNYWVESGGSSSLLREYLKGHDLEDPASYGQQKTISVEQLKVSFDKDSVNDLALLTQAGYLTVRERTGKSLVLGYPNLEVASSMAAVYAKTLLGDRSFDEAGVQWPGTALLEGNADELMRRLNQAFLSMDYQRYPVANEAACRAYAGVFLAGAGFFASPEIHSALGRSDLECCAGTKRWVFEFKFCKAGTGREEALLEEAKSQIAEKRYGEASGKSLVRVAAVFSEERRQFALWAMVPESGKAGS